MQHFRGIKDDIFFLKGQSFDFHLLSLGQITLYFYVYLLWEKASCLDLRVGYTVRLCNFIFKKFVYMSLQLVPQVWKCFWKVPSLNSNVNHQKSQTKQNKHTAQHVFIFPELKMVEGWLWALVSLETGQMWCTAPVGKLIIKNIFCYKYVADRSTEKYKPYIMQTCVCMSKL